MKVGFGLYAFFLLSQLAVVVEAIDSWRSRIFLPSQMMARYYRSGINFLTHGGMWGDMFLLPPMLCYMLGHTGAWSVHHDWPFALVGTGLTMLNHVLLTNNEQPDPFGFLDLRSSPAITVHAVYMAVYLTIIGRFYVNPVDVNPTAIATLSILLGIHVAAGTHIFLGMANLVYRWRWCPDILANPAVWAMNAGTWVVLAVLATYAGGWLAGLYTIGAGCILAVLVVGFVRVMPPLVRHGR